MREILLFLDAVGMYDVLIPFILILVLTMWILIIKFYKKDDSTTKKVLKIIGFYIGSKIVAFIIIAISNLMAVFVNILGWIRYVCILGLVGYLFYLRSKK